MVRLVQEGEKKAEQNPLLFDDELKDLLSTLSEIKSYKRFKGWKKNFLERLQSFVNDKGVERAASSYKEFQGMMKRMEACRVKCTTMIEKGDLTNEKTTVKGRNALAEMCKNLQQACTETDELIPSSKTDERKKHYNKFQLGCVLVEDGFSEFDNMKNLSESVLSMGKEQLSQVADKQQLDLFVRYAQEFKKFCDVMQDLGLYEVMLACRKFAEEPEEEEIEPIKLTIETDDGKKIRLELDPGETIGNIKDAIVDACGIKAAEQILKFRGKELNDNSKTLEDLNIPHGAVMKVSPFKVPITVNTMDGKKIKVMADPSKSLKDLKKQLQEESGIPPQNQRLFMNGDELKDDNKTAADYGIVGGSVLDLEPKQVKVNVEMPDGKKVEVDIATSDTTDSIKAKIKAKTGMDVPRQVLEHKGKELPTGGETVKDMGIRDGDDIKVKVFKVPISVTTLEGKKYKMLVDPTDTLAAIKKKLEGKSGLPVSNQALFMKGKELEGDNKSAADHGIKGGSELNLEPKSIKVSVEMPDGKTIAVDVKPSDTADSIKKKIKSETGMEVPRQVLKFKGKELPSNGETVKDIGIKNGDGLKVEVLKVPITVNTMDGKKIKVMVDPSDKLGDIKKQLEGKSGVPANNQNLFMNGNKLDDDNKTAGDYGIEEGSELDLEPKSIKVSVEMPDGKTIAVDVKPSDTSKDIKTKIKDKTGMTVPRQVLKLNGKELPSNGETVKDMGIKDGDDLKVEVYKVPITVNTADGKKIRVMVDPSDKLGDIKKQLEDKSGLPAGNQNLFMNGNELGDDKKTAADYGIKEGSELDLEPKSIKVSVEMPDGKTIAVDVKPSDTSKDIKAKIKKETGMAVPRQVLKFKGKELPSSKGDTVKDLGIKDGDDLKVEIFKVPITVNTMDGKKIKVMVDPSDTLGDIKKQLEDGTGVSADNQKIYLNGKELKDNGKTAGDHGIKAGSELDLEPKSMNINVEMPDGSTHAFKVTPSDTADSIKAKIANETGVAVPRQVLKFCGNELKGKGKKIKDFEIRDGSTLNVEYFKIPIEVETQDKKILKLDVEPCDTIDTVKKMIQKKINLAPEKQCLKLGKAELKNGGDTVDQSGIKKGSKLTVEPHMDPIVFLDIKCGTLFAVDREEVIKKGALTMHQNNKLDFTEAAQGSAEKDKIKTVMLDSPTLGVAPQVVVEKSEIDDYEFKEAEKVKNKWGVTLKKREKNKKGEEFLYVDIKTGACGELSRKKYIDMNFITPVGNGKGETLKEGEKDTQMYDKYVASIREIFGIQIAR